MMKKMYNFPLNKQHALKASRECELRIYTFVTLAVDGGETDSCFDTLIAGERTLGRNLVGNVIRSRVELDTVSKKNVPNPAGNNKTN
jgi:hypothetical protein